MVVCAAMANIKSQDLQGKEKEMLKELDNWKVKLSQPHVSNVTGRVASKLSKIQVVHKSITCALTTLTSLRKRILEDSTRASSTSPWNCGPRKCVPRAAGSTNMRRTRRLRSSSERNCCVHCGCMWSMPEHCMSINWLGIKRNAEGNFSS